MAHHIEKSTGDIVIDSWEQGIADAPEQGIAMMRNINLISIPGEACVNFATSAVNIPPTVTSAACTFNSGADTITWTPGAVTLYYGVTITFDATGGGVTQNKVYWVGSISGSTFKIYNTPGRDISTLVDLTANSTPNFSTITFGKPTYKTIDVIGTATSPNNVFILDANGRTWWVDLSSNLVHIGPLITATGLEPATSTHGNGICALGAFLYVFFDAQIDYIPIDAITNTSATAGQWVNNWKAITSPPIGANYSHYALTAQDNGMYFCNSQTIGSVLAKSGANTIDPSNSATYIFNASALLLPSVDRSVCLAELGTSLLVGAIQNKVYPWDRISTSYQYPLILSENLTTRMVTTNSSTYIFAGNRGRIYITNGSNVNLFKKIPDQITNGTDPYFTWLDAMYWKNQIYFSFLTSTNAGVSITTLGGVWALDVSMNIMGTPTSVALRMCNTLSGGSSYYPYVLAPNIRSTTPAGAGLYIGCSTGSVHGVDVTTSTPYNDYTGGVGGEIYTDLISTATMLNPKTFSQIEFKLATPLVSGEAVKISAHQNYSTTWVAGDVVGSTTTVGVLSDKYPVNFQAGDSKNASGQWIQLYVQLQSTSTTPSYVRLKEIRIR